MNERVSNNNYGYERGTICQNVAINQLASAPTYPNIFGVVIGKNNSRFVATKKGDNRCVLNFTIRDSPYDIINAECWGDEVMVKIIKESFSIGDVVKISNPQIATKQVDARDEKFKPFATSPYELKISPRYSDVTLCAGPEVAHYHRFLHLPVHPPNEFLTLGDIICDSQNMDGVTVNLLVAIKKIGTCHEMKSKDGRPLKKLEVEIFDQTCSSFPLLIWDSEVANFITGCFAVKTIVLISDIRINFSSFISGMVATVTSSTILTPDPETPDARVLYQFVQTAKMENKPNPINTVSHIYTIDQICQMIAHRNYPLFEDTFGTVFAYISNFNIDGFMKTTSYRCPECKSSLKDANRRCVNGNCEIGAGVKAANGEEVFDVIIRLSDHSGSLERCSLSGAVAESLLQCKVSEFKALSSNELTHMKWRHLFEFFKIEFKLPQGAALYDNPIVRITSCIPANVDEVATFYTKML